jgi:hypothetical protein
VDLWAVLAEGPDNRRRDPTEALDLSGDRRGSGVWEEGSIELSCGGVPLFDGLARSRFHPRVAVVGKAEPYQKGQKLMVLTSTTSLLPPALSSVKTISGRMPRMCCTACSTLAAAKPASVAAWVATVGCGELLEPSPEHGISAPST